ncbi:MAG TPA: TIGR04255 family protein [Caulobacteraceae bacterium]|nr:TIGR04255 family protein [Caulobacteraceae bacterium]
MTETPALPHFRRAPVTEFAISIQFEALDKFNFAHIGPLHQSFASEFPGIEFHPPIPPMIEVFGPVTPTINLPFLLPWASIGQIPRMWMLDDKNEKLIQFQQDRFVINWRKTKENMEYPRYPGLRDEFFVDLEKLRAFLSERELGEIIPVQCELTYVNQVPAPEGVAELSARAFANWRELRPTRLGSPEDVAINQRFVIRGDDGGPIGRIYFQSAPSAQPVETRSVQLMMIGRAAPSSRSLNAARERLDSMHELIVLSFVELMSKEIQQEWEPA